jgi:predicted carbohydrate-binding protein with CBM5 and CBM33 domain
VTVRRLAAATGAAALLWVAAPALPAAAHGATDNPISRTAACAGGGERTGDPACVAAKAANGGAFGSFDNLRIANVGGNDRKAVPDGKLCSGGLGGYQGLDLARGDFPATTVTGGKTLQIKYRATIAHQGSFRVYLTRQGYDPKVKLRWSDLGGAPLLDVADPPLQDGAFRMSVKLPERTGRQILYIVWETSNTPDTYYSCSDLSFPASAKAPAAPAAATTKPAPEATSAAPRTKPATAAPTEAPAEAVAATVVPPSAAAPAGTAARAADEPRTQTLTRVGDESRSSLGHGLISGAVIVGLGAVAWAAVARFLRRRAGIR